MIELAKHIEYLLLENDCVVIPNFGGFIAHHQPAHYEEAEGIFLPPTRTIGFNPQLTMNDGMLAQSYMQAYHTDFPDATRKIEETVDRLKEQLYSDGMAEFHSIGTMRYNIYGMYEFEPNESGALSPSLYGLSSFCMPVLTETYTDEAPKVIEKPQETPEPKQKEYRLNSHRWMGNAVAVAIALIMFFLLSSPVENTYIDKGHYASLGTDCLFDAIRSHSMATSLNHPSKKVEAPQLAKTKEPKPIIVKVEKVAPAPKTEETKKEEILLVSPAKEVKTEVVSTAHQKETQTFVKQNLKKYHIIVASLATSVDAQKSLESFKKKGYSNVSIIKGSGRFRISLCNYTDKSTANQKLNELKQDNAFSGAWLLTSK